MRKSVAGLAVVFLVAAAGALWLLQERRGAGSVSTVEEGGDGYVSAEAVASDPRVRVSSPRPNAVVSSPLVVRGEARGPWYFEGDFPVRLLAGDGSEVAAGPAQAQGAWMTDSLVPFEATLTFERPAAETGLLVLDRSNPSGLARNAAQVVVPVRFGESAPSTRAVRAFFSNSALGDDECDAVWPVARGVEPMRPDGRAALAEVLGGPTGAERSRGFRTNIPEGVELRSLTVEEGTARADFDRTLDRAAGSCRVLAVRAQIERTLLQLPAVEEVVISVDGDTEQALQP